MTSEVPQQLNLQLPLAKPLDRRALVDYIQGTPGLQETDYLEWKVGYDLSRRPVAAQVAKHLIGFANRTVAAASRHHQGFAYLAVGVEPGELSGVPEWDSAQIQDWLKRFVESELRYDIHYVLVKDKRVLLFTIDPPRAGDPIYALQQTSVDENGKTLREASIYVRYPGQTEPPSANDLKALQARLAAGASLGPRLDVRVEVDDSDLHAFSEEVVTPQFRDKELSDYRKSALAPLPDPEASRMFGRPITFGEGREPEEFVDAVDRFVDAATSRWWSYIANEQIGLAPAWLDFIVVNDTDENFEDVVIEVRLPLSRDAVHVDEDDAADTLDPPVRPPEWGSGQSWQVRPLSSPTDAVIEREADMTLVRFAPFRVRPRSRHRLQSVLLALHPEFGGRTLESVWRGTASNTRGDLTGVVSFRVRDWPEYLASLEAAKQVGQERDVGRGSMLGLG